MTQESHIHDTILLQIKLVIVCITKVPPNSHNPKPIQIRDDIKIGWQQLQQVANGRW